MNERTKWMKQMKESPKRLNKFRKWIGEKHENDPRIKGRKKRGAGVKKQTIGRKKKKESIPNNTIKNKR